MTRRSAEVPFAVVCDFDPARPEVALRSHGADVAVRRGGKHGVQRAGKREGSGGGAPGVVARRIRDGTQAA